MVMLFDTILAPDRGTSKATLREKLHLPTWGQTPGAIFGQSTSSMERDAISLH